MENLFLVFLHAFAIITRRFEHSNSDLFYTLLLMRNTYDENQASQKTRK